MGGGGKGEKERRNEGRWGREAMTLTVENATKEQSYFVDHRQVQKVKCTI